MLKHAAAVWCRSQTDETGTPSLKYVCAAPPETAANGKRSRLADDWADADEDEDDIAEELME